MTLFHLYRGSSCLSIGSSDQSGGFFKSNPMVPYPDNSNSSTIQSIWSSYPQWVFLTNPVVHLSNSVDPPTLNGFSWPIQLFIYPIQLILLPSMGFPDQSSCSSIQSSWSSYPQWVFLTNLVVHLSYPVDPPTLNGFSWPIHWFIYPIQFVPRRLFIPALQ